MSTYGSYVYPGWASIVGWSLSMLSIAAIPVYALFKILTYPHGSFYEVRPIYKYLIEIFNILIIFLLLSTALAYINTSITKMVNN